MRKYESIPQAYRIIGKFNMGDSIIIEEKLDGSNASFTFNEKTRELEMFSRKTQLSDSDTLSGFVPYIREKVENADMPDLCFMAFPQYIFYGEWLRKHKVIYKKEFFPEFYLFDIALKATGEYLPRYAITLWADRLNVSTPKVLYAGEYKGVEHLMGFVGKSDISDPENNGEGIVVRNISQGTICKIVREGFSEIKQKSIKVVNQDFVSLYEQLCPVYRIEKALHKGIDNGDFKSFDTSEYGKIMQYIGNYIPEDILAENSDLIPENIDVVEFIKFIKKRLPILTKQAINNIESEVEGFE